MPSIYPSPSTLQSNFSASNQQRQPFTAWSAIDDIKQKTDGLSNKAQAKTGNIELFSGKYYAACTFGGLLACVSIHLN